MYSYITFSLSLSFLIAVYFQIKRFHYSVTQQASKRVRESGVFTFFFLVCNVDDDIQRVEKKQGYPNNIIFTKHKTNLNSERERESQIKINDLHTLLYIYIYLSVI